MDKQTLSGYGWVVCVILVISLMVGFAGHFAEEIRDGVVGNVNNVENRLEAGLNYENDNPFDGDSGSGEDPDESQGPVKNEYGFYYDVAYVGQNDSGSYNAIVFRSNGTFIEFYGDSLDYLIASSEPGNFTYDASTKTAGAGADDEYRGVKFSEDGLSGSYSSYGTVVDCTISDLVVQGVKYGEVYNHDGGTYVFSENNTVTMFGSETYDITWTSSHSFYYNEDPRHGEFTLDGLHLKVEGME